MPPIDCLSSIDRELAFYRKRSGQVFFIGMSLEVAILLGQQRMPGHPVWPWLAPFTITVLFYAVAAGGIVLGSEYRRRIRHIKNSRTRLLAAHAVGNPFPSDREEKVSEIQVLYVALISSSALGSLVAWIYVAPSAWLLVVYLVTIAGGMLWSVYHVFRCLRAKAPALEDAELAAV